MPQECGLSGVDGHVNKVALVNQVDQRVQQSHQRTTPKKNSIKKATSSQVKSVKRKASSSLFVSLWSQKHRKIEHALKKRTHVLSNLQCLSSSRRFFTLLYLFKVSSIHSRHCMISCCSTVEQAGFCFLTLQKKDEHNSTSFHILNVHK